MRGSWLIVLAGLAGCDLVLDLSRPDGPPDGGIDVTCLTSADALRDSFDPDTLGPAWTVQDSNAGGVVTVTGSLNLEANAEGGVEVRSKAAYDLEATEISVRVSSSVEPTTFANHSEIALFAYATDYDPSDGSGHALAWQLLDGKITPGFVENGAFRPVSLGIPYSSVDHRIWTFSRDGAKTSWKLGNGVDPPVTIANDDQIDFARMLRPAMFTLLHNGDVPFLASFDDLDGGGPPAAACPASDLTGDFRVPPLDDLQWGDVFGNSCAPSVQPGTGLVAQPVNSGFECKLTSSTIYDLVDHQIDIRVDPSTLTGDNTGYASITLEDGHILSFVTSATDLSAKVEDASGQMIVATMPGASTYSIWRFVGSKNTEGTEDLEWSIGTPNGTFQRLHKLGGFSGLSRIQLSLGMRGGEYTSGTMVFRGVNVP